MLTTASRIRFQDLPSALAPLQEIDHWVGWRRIERGGRITKPPVALRTGRITDIRNSEAWVSYRRALRLISAGDLEIAGLGFVLLNSPIAALDIDDGIHEGVIAPWAAALLDRTCSYVERTPSGRGLRILGYGSGKPVHIKRKLGSGSIEIYRRATRFITVTGALFDHASLEPIDNLIDALVEEHGSAVPKTGGVKKTPPVSDVPSLDDIDDDLEWQEIIDRVQCRGKCTRSPLSQSSRGCKDLRKLMRVIPSGFRSDVIWKTGRILREHGCSPDQVEMVLAESEAFVSKHGTSLSALAAEVGRIFEKAARGMS